MEVPGVERPGTSLQVSEYLIQKYGTFTHFSDLCLEVTKRREHTVAILLGIHVYQGVNAHCIHMTGDGDQPNTRH